MADDPFATINPPTIVGVRDIKYRLYDPDPDGSEQQAMEYEAEIVWSNGAITKERGDVVPHLTSAEVTGLQSLMSRLRGKAEAAWGNA